MCSRRRFLWGIPGVLSVISLCASAWAQMPMPVQSPEIQKDRQVTFRLRAPKATEVAVTGQWAKQGPIKMTKGEGDVWSVTTGPIEPGVWEYSFQVDGLSMIDPGNTAIKPMREPRTSILQIAGEPPLLTDFQNVPHGVVRQHTYFSKSLDRRRELTVYTPPNYDKDVEKKYPTLYLQHGMGDNQATWTAHGKAHWILDNLIAQGKAKPMVVVMMDGHAAIPGKADGQALFESNTALFQKDLFEDVMPFVEANYRVKADAENRALVGLSMGGGQSLTIGLNNPDRFAWVGGFSSAVPKNEAISSALNDPEALNKKLKLLWIGCGKNDFLIKMNEQFIEQLKEKKIKYEWNQSEGDHSWPVWRMYLSELAPKLFQ